MVSITVEVSVAHPEIAGLSKIRQCRAFGALWEHRYEYVLTRLPKDTLPLTNHIT